MTPTRQLTARQQEVLDRIRFLSAQNGYPPSIRELAGCLGSKSPNGMMCHLAALVKNGHLTRAGKGKSRTLRLIATERRCPHCGKEIE